MSYYHGVSVTGDTQQVSSVVGPADVLFAPDLRISSPREEIAHLLYCLRMECKIR